MAHPASVQTSSHLIAQQLTTACMPGAGADSFFEYLLKAALLLDKAEYFEFFREVRHCQTICIYQFAMLIFSGQTPPGL